MDGTRVLPVTLNTHEIVNCMPTLRRVRGALAEAAGQMVDDERMSAY